MPLSRRDFLRLGGLTAVVAGTTSCSLIGRELGQQALPETLAVPTAVSPDAPLTTQATGLPAMTVDPIRRMLNRAGFGPAPGEMERAAGMGLEAYLEEQLHPEAIEDQANELLMRNLTLYHMDVSEIREQEPRDGVRELIGTTLVRAVYSKRQLYEAMVEFWSDHFNIYIGKSPRMPLAKIIDDRDVIRPYALGKFRDLLFASAKSPAMLIYLDNIRNLKEEPNENYARELMELHTLGVNAGYTQQDVSELARILTGWTIERRGRKAGQFVFKPAQHDFGPKQLLGHTFPAGRGAEEVEEVLEILVTHPATANFMATKLVRRFVADDPPQALVERVAQTFQATDGDIKSMLRVIFLSPEFATAPPKLKRPFTYMVSVCRALHTDLRLGRGRAIGAWMERLGQPLFHWPPPDGYPDTSAAWAANLLPRWNFALALLHSDLPGATPSLERIMAAGQVDSPPQILQLFAGLVYGRALNEDELTLFTNYVTGQTITARETQLRLKDSVALMFASPAFQWT